MKLRNEAKTGAAPARYSAFTVFGLPRCPGEASRLNQDRIADKVDADPARSGAFVKVNCDRLRDLLLQIAEILPLRGDATHAVRVIPRCHEPTRLLVTLDLKSDFFHYLEPLLHRAGILPRQIRLKM